MPFSEGPRLDPASRIDSKAPKGLDPVGRQLPSDDGPSRVGHPSRTEEAVDEQQVLTGPEVFGKAPDALPGRPLEQDGGGRRPTVWSTIDLAWSLHVCGRSAFREQAPQLRGEVSEHNFTFGAFGNLGQKLRQPVGMGF